MKHLILLSAIMLLCSSSAHAGWFSKKPDPLLAEAKEKIVTLENQIAVQGSQLTHKDQILNRWQIASGIMAVLCVVFLITGTALGATTRKHHDQTTLGRLGSSPSSNGTKPLHVAKAPKANATATLATREAA